jgi:flagellar biosynthetic protein FliO
MEQTQIESGTEAPSTAGLFVRTLGALLLIVGLIVAVAWGLRRFGGAHFGVPSEEAPELAVLATVSLGDRRALSAVRFGDRLLLVGSTAQAITLLATRVCPPRNVTPRMRSVADLLREDEPPSFEQALSLADERLKQQTSASVLRSDGKEII